MSQTTPEQKLANVIAPIFEAKLSASNDSHIIRHQDLLVKLEMLEKTLAGLVAVVEGSVKKIAKDKKPEVATAEKTTPTKPFASNKLFYFKELFAKDEDFRKEYVVDEAMKNAIETDKNVQSKTKEDQKNIARATAAWNYLKKFNEAKFAEFGSRYDVDKKAYEDAAKPAQQTVESTTPPAEKA